jgi:UDP-glucose-4-epimerase GalE
MKIGHEILVTGGAGYIGSQTCKFLSTSGFQPVVVDNLSTGFIHNVKWGPLYAFDLLEKAQLREVFRNHSFKAIIHFAASAYVAESMSAPMKYFENNVVSTINLLEIALEHNVEKIVFSSSCATYGDSILQKIEEGSVQRPINVYGETKLMGENILRSLEKLGRLRYVTLRYFNAGGADFDLELGEEHHPETHVIPILVESALQSKKFVVYGNDYPTVDGTTVRDYIHVWDLANAHTSAIRYLLDGGKSTEINLGTGIGVSTLQLIESILNLGYVVDHEIYSRREGDSARLVAETSRAQDILGWEARYSEISEILKSAIAWRVKH